MQHNHIGFLTQSGFIVPTVTLKSRLGNKYSAFLNKLTLSHPQKIGPPKILRMYKESKYNNIDCIFLPRTLIASMKGILANIEIIIPERRVIVAPLQINLFDNQRLIVNHLIRTVYTPERIANGTATGILNLRAGCGKTFVAAGIIAELNMPTLYIVPKRPLAVQAAKDLRSCFYTDNTLKQNVIINNYDGKKGAINNADITIIVINSALMRPPEFFARYSLIILDEVHTYCTPKRVDIFYKCARAVLAMSATTENRPDRFDTFAHKALAFDNVIRADMINGFEYGENVKFDCQARIIEYYGPDKYTENLTHETTGHIFTHYMHLQALKDPYRLKIVVDELIALYDWRNESSKMHEGIFVFAEEIDLLIVARCAIIDALKTRNRDDIINDMMCVGGQKNLTNEGALMQNDQTHLTNEMRLFIGGMSDDHITDIVTNGRILFTTYGLAGTGTSIPKMTAMLLLTSRRAGFQQIFPRIMRLGSDPTIPRVVVDIIDKRTIMKAQFGSRKIAYEYYDYKLATKKVYADIDPHNINK